MKSFWQKREINSFSPPTGRIDADIAILGAGYTGSWLAHWLKDTGLKTVVLERETPGSGASGRNGGLLLQGGSQLLGEAAASLGRDTAIALWQKTRDSLHWVADMAQRYPIDYRRTGSLYVAGDAEERPVASETVQLMTQAGIPARLVTPNEQPPSIQRLQYDWGAWFPDDATLHPVKLINALLTDAAARGVEVYSHAHVDGWDEASHGLALRGDGFTVYANTLLIATNAEIPSQLSQLVPYVRPVRGQMLATPPIDRLDHDYPVYAYYGYNYWHQRPDGRLLVGGFRHLQPDKEIGTQLALNEAIQQRLERLAADLAGHPVPVDQRWAGIMTKTPDHLPLVGMVDERVGVAVAYDGHGSTMTPLAAKLLRDAVVDGKAVCHPLDVNRLFTKEPHTES